MTDKPTSSMKTRTAKEFTRRTVLKGSVAAGVVAVTGCATGSKTPREPGRLRVGPRVSGGLRVGLGHGSTTDSLDPATFEHGFTIFTGYAYRNHLTEVSNTEDLIAELAESWEASDDAMTWTFKLRKGVEFHNGKTLDADDVIASVQHFLDSKSPAKGILKTIQDIKKDDPRTVVFTLSDGNADFAFLLSDYHIAMMPAKDGGVDWQSGVGTGGYMLESFEPGVSASFKRNPNYWKEGRAHFDAVEVITIADVAARTNALRAGEIDVMDRVDLRTAHLLASRRKKDIRVEETSGTAHYSVPMRTDMAPFDNNDVRLALKYAVDREALLQTILRGHGVLGNDHPIGRSNRYYAHELPQRVYDPDKAKFHLKKAGVSNLTVELSAADAAFGGAVDAAVLYKKHAAKAGITINVVREPNDGYWSNVWMKKPWCMSYWGGRPTEDWMFSTAYAGGANWNDTFWNHERFNKLLLEARAELNEPKRREMYVEMQRIVSDEGGVVIPMFNNYVFAMSQKVQHDEAMAGNRDLDGYKGLERWWFAEAGEV